jgi:serine/threonine-protein kinase RsbW
LKPAPPLWHNQAILTETEFVLHGRMEELDRLAAETGKFCHDHSLDEEVEFDLNLVLEELFTNSVKHGGCEGMENAVQVRLQILNESVPNKAVQVEFADSGTPFNPLTAPVPNLEAALEERSIGGLGVHLVRQIMRDLEYRRAGEWNRLTMQRPC